MRAEVSFLLARCLAANASYQAANNADCKQEQCYENTNTQWALEEDDERAFPVGVLDVRLQLAVQLLVIGENVGGVELVGDVIAAEVIDHALRLFGLVWILLFQHQVDNAISGIICIIFDYVRLDKGSRADDKKRNQNEFAESFWKRKQVSVSSQRSRITIP